MVAITSAGVGSGLDINDLVGKLVAAEGDPTTKRLDRQEATLQARLSAYGTLKGALSELKSSLVKLTSLQSQAMRATSGDTEVFTATATSVASPADHSIEVSHLAQAQRLASKPFSALNEEVGTGTLVFRFGSYDAESNVFEADPAQATREVVIGSDGMTLEGVRDAINEADIGVRASVVNDGSGYRLVVASLQTGAAHSVEVTVSDADGDPLDDAGLSQLAYDPIASGPGMGKNLSQTQAAQDALLTVDGLDVTRPTNTVTGVIPGVTLNLAKAAPDQSIPLKVALSTEDASATIAQFVSSLNGLMGTMAGLSSYNAETQQGGLLLGDATLRGIGMQIRRAVGDSLSNAPGELHSLGAVGISFQRDGSVQLDSERLSALLDQDFDAVSDVFSAATDRLDGLLSGLLASDGALDSSTEGLTARIGEITRQREALALRLERLEQRYRAQFTALDALVAQLQSTGDFLTRQFDVLAGNNGK